MKKLKLINLIKKPVIEKVSMAKLRGGDGPCCCGCCGPSGSDANYSANLAAGYTCPCGDSMYGS
jgi:natural product precursor